MFNLPTTVRTDDPNRVTLPPAKTVSLGVTPGFGELVDALDRLHRHHGKSLATDRQLAAAGFPQLSLTPADAVHEDLHLRSLLHHVTLHAMGIAPKQPAHFRGIGDMLAQVQVKKRTSKTRSKTA